MIRLRIVSKDGIGPFTRVENAETGELLDGVTKVTWTASADSLASATIEVQMVAIDVVGEADI